MNRNSKRNYRMKKVPEKVMVAALVSSMVISPAVSITTPNFNVSAATLENATSAVAILESKGWLESAIVEWNAVEGASGYNVYYKLASASDSGYKKIDSQLIRKYPTYFRADVLGLAQGDYVVKVVPIINNAEASSAQAITQNISVKANVREGFAFSAQSPAKTGSGGYNDNGTVPSNAQIVYVTAANVNTVTLDVITSSSGTKTTSTGLANILTNRGKGYDKTPLIIRMIGEIKGSDIVGLNSTGYLQLKGIYNVTFEGVGEDATAYQFGLLVRDAHNLEIRNIGLMLFPDDGISLDTGNDNIWVHNNDIFYGSAGSDADQVKGDGSCDVKGLSTYVTIAYNHFYDSGKASLCGMSDTENFYVTYHHNWYDHSDSRHPRIRVGTIHIYNNYFDGNSKYGVGVTKGSSAFVENNYFRNCKYPMLSSLQGTDIYGGSVGTFSGEAGGMIKAYNNTVEGASRLVYANQDATQFDAYLATSRNEAVPSSYKTVSGGTTYNNFDTSATMYSYKPDAVEDVKTNVTTYAGRVEGGDFVWNFTTADDTDYGVNTALMNKIKSYQSPLVASTGGTTTPGTGTTDPGTGTTDPGTGTTDPGTGTTDPGTGTTNPGTGTTTPGTTLLKLNASTDLVSGASYTSATTVNGFTIMGTGTYPLTVDSSSKTCGSNSYTLRLKTNGTGAEGKRSIQFTTQNSGKLIVHAISGGSADRPLALSKGGTIISSTTIGYAALNEYVIDIPSAGTYEIFANDGGGINFYYLEVTGASTSGTTDPGTGTTTPGTGTTDPGTGTTTPGTGTTDPGTGTTPPSTGTTGTHGTSTGIGSKADSAFVNAIYCSPTGTALSTGTKESPMSIEAAISKVQPGGTILLMGGTYSFSKQLTIPVGNNGTASAYKTIKACQGAKVTFDFSAESYNLSDPSTNDRGIQLEGNYWHIYGIRVTGAADNGMFVCGNNNIVEYSVFEANRDTGLQISRRASTLATIDLWPTNNLILNCTSFNNSDTATGENADGFAAKLTCGPGNVFDGCMSYNNVDDGWDLYAKPETGPIGAVTMKNCIAFRNGQTTTGAFTANSDGNGFKLGGSGIANDHVVINCISFENKNHGFTDNSNPGTITIDSCTSFNNSQADGGKSNFDFARTTASHNIFKNLISFSNTKVSSDKYLGVATNCSFQNGGKYYLIGDTQNVNSTVSTSKGTLNTAGVTAADFVSINSPATGADVHTLWRNADGTINTQGFLMIASTSGYNTKGAVFGASTSTTPTDPVITTKVGDVNKDNSINSLDLALLKKMVLNGSTSADLPVADMNSDGSINSLDLALLKKFLLS